MDIVIYFGIVALVIASWVVTMMAYGACIAAARADQATQQFTRQQFFGLNKPGRPNSSQKRGGERQNPIRI